ncbi:MAG: GNAT family N-acetyltransferase [Gammaproteobacteria bacterium]
MNNTLKLRLANPEDAERIARMSRDLIEEGLGWSWIPARVESRIQARETLVLTAKVPGALVGFAIMEFLEEDAHLALLAVSPPYQRCGIGHRLVRWLEKSAEVAGISAIHLELRAGNLAAHAFYRSLGYREVGLLPRYYRAQEAAIRMMRQLRALRWSEFSNKQRLTPPFLSS